MSEHFEALYPENTQEQALLTFISYVKKGKSVQVCGLPGSGKSNLLGFLPYNKTIRTHILGKDERWFHFVYMDSSEIKGRTLFDVTKFILISLSYSLSERGYQDEASYINTLLKEGLEFNDELILFQSLKKSIDFLAIEKEFTVVLLFDRFDEYIQDATNQFFSNLKILRNRAKFRFSSVFSLTRPLEIQIDPEVISTFYEFVAGNIIFVPLFDEPGLKFRISYLEKAIGKSLSKAEKENIFTLTGGHNQLTLALAEAFLSSPAVKDENILKNPQIVASLYTIYKSLTPEEQACLRLKKYKNPPQYLLDSHLIIKDMLSMPLLEQFLTSLPIQKSRIIFEENSNELIMDERHLSSSLSSSEFKLLKFLVLNKGRICEKDEIINAVWQEQATQEGVTDQALDQVIYRLRKKIEQDPNNPSLILTIKGRGYQIPE